METKTTPQGAASSPAAPTAAPKRVEIPAGPVTGRTGDALLAQAIGNVFLTPDAPEPSAEGAAGNPAPTNPPPGGEGTDPAKSNLPPEGGVAGVEPVEPPAFNTLSAAEQAEISERAQGNGVTPEEQHAAEAKELARLEAKAKAEGKTVEEVAAEEAGTEAEPAKTFTQAQLEEIVQKRVKNLAAENESLKRQLAEAPAVQTGGPLAEITDPARLAQIQTEAQEGIEQADDLLAQLASDPEGVETELRKLLGKDVEGKELTPQQMAQYLRQGKKSCQSLLRMVPQRQQFLSTQAQVHAKVIQQDAPWLTDEADPRTAAFRQLERALPGIKQTASWEYWLSAAVEKHLERQAAAAKLPNGSPARPANGKFVPRVTFPKTASRGGGAAPNRPAADGGKADRVAAAKAALAKDPTNPKLMDAVIAAKMS